MISLLKRGLALTLFAVGLLAGLQLPGFVQQYEQRVSARLAEAELSLVGFQAIADKFHGGELAALIEHHRRSRDASFRAEAEVIYAQWKRVAVLSNEFTALKAPLPKQLWHLLWGGNREILGSTARGYSHVVPINTGAIVSGLIGGLLLLGIFILVNFVVRLFVQARNKDDFSSLPPASATTGGSDKHNKHEVAQSNTAASLSK